MNHIEAAYLNLIHDVILEEKAADPKLKTEEWESLLRLAENSGLYPFMLDLASGLPSFDAALEALRVSFKDPALPDKAMSPDQRRLRRELTLKQFCDQPVTEEEGRELRDALPDHGPESLHTTSERLLCLILRGYRQFCGGNFRVSSVPEICLYTWCCGEQIDFRSVLESCAACGCERFAAAVYRIGETYLDIPIPEPFAAVKDDGLVLL